MDQWLSVDQSYVGPHLRALAIERVLKKHEGVPADAAIERASEGALAYALGVIDRALGEGDYLAGGHFSLADISLMPYVASLPMVQAGHLLGGLSRLGSWWERVSARPSWKRALEPERFSAPRDAACA